MTVVAEVSRLPYQTGAVRGASPGEDDHAIGMFEEIIDHLRTCLMLSEGREDVQVLAVTSAVPGEGKTSVSAQLAVSIARSTGEPTLLIDADMRKPDVYRMFQIPNEPGLADLLDDKCDLESAILTTCSDHIHVLPAGQLHKSPHTLLGSEQFVSLLKRFRQTYRFVVIDTAPILAASETLVIAKQADGTLVCAMQNHSRTNQLRQVCQRLEATGARPVGTVLNGVSSRQYASRYGGYGYERYRYKGR